jgi:hypothetical protein
MEFITNALTWLKGSNGAALFAILFALSEAIGMIPSVKASGVFQAIVNALGWIKNNLLKAPEQK